MGAGDDWVETSIVDCTVVGVGSMWNVDVYGLFRWVDDSCCEEPLEPPGVDVGGVGWLESLRLPSLEDGFGWGEPLRLPDVVGRVDGSEPGDALELPSIGAGRADVLGCGEPLKVF